MKSLALLQAAIAACASVEPAPRPLSPDPVLDGAADTTRRSAPLPPPHLRAAFRSR
ncbi:hypothetical protein LXT12_10470 [Pelomonas sp. P7]|uniref:Uncharacterized protein n=1 Tax=Pelomonas caseinilytica TaxID=2906763 RepID=A0ABS8XF96_9BURK|nr:hypothetical protein [Pelomonas sp. P7]MCE4537672.1 hypothetical protein [Pelomonas sp. P7]